MRDAADLSVASKWASEHESDGMFYGSLGGLWYFENDKDAAFFKLKFG